MDFDYKKYSLEKLNEWMHDVLSCSEATPQEIYDTIKKVVQENYYTYKNETQKCYELLSLLNGNYEYAIDPRGNGVLVDKILECDKDNQSPECQGAWNSFWKDVDENHSREYNLREAEYYNKRVEVDSVKKWVIPVEVDGLSGESYVNFPNDLLEAANLKENDRVEWIDNKDGSFTMRKS